MKKAKQLMPRVSFIRGAVFSAMYLLGQWGCGGDPTAGGGADESIFNQKGSKGTLISTNRNVKDRLGRHPDNGGNGDSGQSGGNNNGGDNGQTSQPQLPEQHCNNQQLDPDLGEQGVDCGGPCAPCPSCTDTFKNGDETDVDCGGATCPKCNVNKTCKKNTDCKNNNCKGATATQLGKCTTPPPPPPPPAPRNWTCSRDNNGVKERHPNFPCSQQETCSGCNDPNKRRCPDGWESGTC